MNFWGKLIVAGVACLAFFLLPALSHVDTAAHLDCASEHGCSDTVPSSDAAPSHDCKCPCHHAFTALITVQTTLSIAFVPLAFPQPRAERECEGISVSIERPPSLS